MQRRARTDEDKRKKSERILLAAREIFVDRGFHETTVEMITERAGVSIGTFYVYYKNKIEIYKALQNEGLDILLGMFNETMARSGLTARGRIDEISRTYLSYYRRHREYFDIMAILSATPPELKETDSPLSRVIDGKTYQLLKAIEGVLEEGVGNGEFVIGDTWETTNILWGLMDGLILLEERNNIQNVIGSGLEELLDRALEVIMDGIAKRH